eukprot:scaffold210488_cov25-Tisochrysis_lutea.AAC.1
MGIEGLLHSAQKEDPFAGLEPHAQSSRSDGLGSLVLGSYLRKSAARQEAQRSTTCLWSPPSFRPSDLRAYKPCIRSRSSEGGVLGGSMRP